MRAAIYARVSTADQQTLPLQIQRMEEYAATQAWTITQQVEEQASGAKDSRPKRAEILNPPEGEKSTWFSSGSSTAGAGAWRTWRRPSMSCKSWAWAL